MDDHAEDVLSFEFGVRSLLRISLELIIEKTPDYFARQQISELPAHLYDILCKRIYDDPDKLYPFTTSPSSTTNPYLDRKNILHKGI